MLQNIKLLLNLTDSSKDELLLLLIDQCTNDALQYTHQDCIGCMQGAVEQLVVYRYNRISTEGVNSESYSGLSYNYQDYETYRNTLLKKYRKMKVF